MSTQPRPPITGLAEQVVRSDVAAQQSIGTWEKGTWTRTTQIATGGDWMRKAIAVIAGIAVLGVGIVTGFTLLNNQPSATLKPTLAPTGVAAQPTPTAQTTSAVQTQPPATVTAAPSATAAPIATPVPILIADGVDEILTGDPVGYDDANDDQGVEGEGDPDVGAKAGSELTTGYVAPANVDGGQAFAMVDGWMAGTVRAAQVEDLWPCTGEGVFCGPAELEPGDYFVVGFSTAGPPSTTGTDLIYENYYVMTDLDGDWTNNGLATPPRTNNVYLSAQYVIEGGWYGTTKGQGETDYQGPIGPDGQTQRYNQQPASRLVLTQDPPGGFFIIPQDRVGKWFRIATIWRDFSQERAIAVDSIGGSGGLTMIPVPGRAELPATLACARVDVLAEALGDQPSQLVGTFKLQSGIGLEQGAALDVTLLTGRGPTATLTQQPGLALADLGNGAYRFNAATPTQTAQSFANLIVASPGGDPLDLTEEFIVLAGSGLGIPADFSGFALGDPACGP